MAPMFELLFNESLASWREAAFELDGPFGAVGLAAAVALALILVAASLRNRPLAASRRWALGILQGVAIAALLAMLWRPSLELERVRAGENGVAWLVDASGSMDTPDAGDAPVARLDAALDALERESLLAGDDFEHALYALGEQAVPVESLDAFAEPGVAGRPLSDVGGALADLLTGVDERALAAVVLVSDGADNVGRIDAAWWRRVAAAGVPVHAIGVGAAARGDDVELVDVTLPERVAADSAVTARLRIGHAPGAPDVRLRVTGGTRLLAAEDVALADDADETVHAVTFDAGDARLAELRFALDAGDVDPNPANDAQARVLSVAESPRRVLYLEGEPRWEFKFIRRALDDEPGVEIVSLLRTSPNKFYRQGVRDADELADGFPAARETLFEYDAVILGSVEAALLSADQQAALRDFVAVRGGSVLMLGGRAGLADGGWARSALAPALPVVLESRVERSTFERARAAVLPTRRGARTDWLALDPEPAASLAAWAELPEVADRQGVGRVKPGASVLLETVAGAPMLVRQRYGRGSSYVLATGGTWRWQMGLPSEDERHETFWRGLVGALAAASPARVEVRPEASAVRDAPATTFTVDARDADWAPLGAEAVVATVLHPDGTRSPAELVADPAVPGRYVAGVELDADGPWGLEIEAVSSGESPSGAPVSATGWTVHDTGTAEAFGALQRVRFLERVAELTGGSYRTLDEAGELPAALETSEAALTRVERLPLWSMPALFLLILGAKALEWLLRLRWRRL